MKFPILAPVVVVLALVVPCRAQGDEWWHRWFGEPGQPSPQQIAEDEKLLRRAKIATDGAGLLDHLQSLQPTPGDAAKVAELFKKIGSDKFKEREQATADLTAMGPKVLPVLKGLLAGTTLEVRLRAERCIKVLEDKSPALMAAAAVRLLKARRPDGAVVALLQFAAHAPDDSVAEEVLDAVFTLGVAKGQLHPALMVAVADQAPATRAIAAVLVARFGDEATTKAVRGLLDDKNPEVRFRAAQGLLARGDRAMLPVLVGCLENAPQPVAERAEEMLLQIGEKTSPKETLGRDEASRKKCCAAWKEWLVTNQANAAIGKASLGFPLPSAEFRAREVVQQMVELMTKAADPAVRDKVVRLTDVPFYQSGQKILNTRDEWQAALKLQANQPMPDGLKYTIEIQAIHHLADYLQNAKQEEKNFLGKFSPAEVRVASVQFNVDFMNQNFKMLIPMYVRISGARGRMFGFGEATTIK